MQQFADQITDFCIIPSCCASWMNTFIESWFNSLLIKSLKFSFLAIFIRIMNYSDSWSWEAVFFIEKSSIIQLYCNYTLHRLFKNKRLNESLKIIDSRAPRFANVCTFVIISLAEKKRRVESLFVPSAWRATKGVSRIAWVRRDAYRVSSDTARGCKW